MRGRTTSAFSLTFLALLPLTRPAPAVEVTPRERGDLAIQTRHILKKYCHECHDGGPKTRGRFVALNHTNLVAAGPHPVPFVVPKDAEKSQLLHFVEDGSMPPGTRKRPTPAETAVLKKWVKAGTPVFPKEFDDAHTTQTILTDLAGKPDAATHFRYFSFAHLIGDGAPPDLAKPVDELRAALTAVGSPPKGHPVIEPVDDCATVYRFDVRTLGWDDRDEFRRLAPRLPGSVYPLTAYDLLLLEYSNPAAPDAKLAAYVRDARLARPVPFLRGDWVSRVLAKDSPLAADLRHLTALAREGKGAPYGPTGRAFGGRTPVPPAPPGTPVTAWYAGDVVPERPPFDLKAEIELDGKPVTAVTTADTFRLRVTTDRNVWFVLLLVRGDGSVVVQPTNKNLFLGAGETVLLTDTGKPFHVTEAGTEYFVLFAAEKELPPPIVVETRHPPGAAPDAPPPVRRCLFGDAKDFDPSRVVRKVIPVTVTAK